MPTTVSAADLDLLRRYDTPTVCNVIELFNIRPRNAGYCDARIQSGYPKLPRRCGFAVTATFRSATPPQGGSQYASVGQQLEMFALVPGPPVVVIQDLDEPVASACFGEISCSMYKRFGCAGLISSGRSEERRVGRVCRRRR